MSSRNNINKETKVHVLQKGLISISSFAIGITGALIGKNLILFLYSQTHSFILMGALFILGILLFRVVEPRRQRSSDLIGRQVWLLAQRFLWIFLLGVAIALIVIPLGGLLPIIFRILVTESGW